MRKTILILSLLAAFSAQAQQAPAAPAPQQAPAGPAAQVAPAKAPPMTQAERDYAAEEARLVQKLRLLELQAKVAELERKIAGTDSPGAPGVGAVAALPPLPPPRVTRPGSIQPEAPVQPDASAGALPPAALALPMDGSDAPSVSSVWGEAGALRAEIRMNGVRQSVAVGDTVAGWKVERIQPQAVTLTKGRQRKTILVVGG